MPTPLQIFPGIIARATQVTHGFLFRRRRPHFRQQAGAQELGELAGVAAIRFDPLAGFARDERWRDHLAAHSRCHHLPLQGIAARPRFVTHAQRFTDSRREAFALLSPVVGV